MIMEELPDSAKLARKLLKVILLPAVILAVVVRFSIAPSAYWIDILFIALFLVGAVLAVVGRVFTPKKDHSTPS